MGKKPSSGASSAKGRPGLLKSSEGPEQPQSWLLCGGSPNTALEGSLAVEDLPNARPPLPPPPDPPPLPACFDGNSQPLQAGEGEQEYVERRGDRQLTKRRGSQILARSSGEPDEMMTAATSKPPEATPEPGSPAPHRRDGNPLTVEKLLPLVRTPETLFGGIATPELCFFGISMPGRGSRRRATIEPDFEEKTCETSTGGAPALQKRREQLETHEGVAVACRKGKKPEQPNQDNFFFSQDRRFRVCAVADGHGEAGHWVSHWVVRCVLRLVLADLASTDALPKEEALVGIFDLAHRTAKKLAETEGFDVALSGTTLTVVVIDRRTRNVIVAWVGDSRCVAGRLTQDTRGRLKDDVAAATSDHKPQDPEERKRIHASGGEVVRLQDDLPHRVFEKGKEAPGLAMSRALGDLVAHRLGVIHEPGIQRFALQADQCLLCCSDGVWEFIKNNEALKAVWQLGRGKVGEAARNLAREARERWLKEEGNITDDITAIVIWGDP